MSLTKPEPPARAHIQDADIKHWSKHWKVEPDKISAAISKVGNSVAAVEKELGIRRLDDLRGNCRAGV